MMMSEKRKVFSWLVSAAICSLLLTTSCAELGEKLPKPTLGLEKLIPKPPAREVTLALRFVPQDVTTYKVVTRKEKSVEFEGFSPETADLKGGRNEDIIEMTFTQQIQSIDDKGNAVAKVTIEHIKYYAKVKKNLVLDYDSSRGADQEHPLTRLIGQSYTIKIAPTGEVVSVVDVSGAQAALGKSFITERTASNLLKPEPIKVRHGTLILPDAEKNQLSTGETWSSTKSYSFGMMGSKAYEKVYTLKRIKRVGKKQMAIIEMNTIPAAGKEQAMGNLSEKFDSAETYTGKLEFDVTAGKVQKYQEELDLDWVIVDPSVQQEDVNEPPTLKMGATRFYTLERMD